jgi:hypothetical protein
MTSLPGISSPPGTKAPSFTGGRDREGPGSRPVLDHGRTDRRAALTGHGRSSDRPYKWAKPAGPEPRQEVEARLRLGYRVWRTLERADGKHIALAWLLGANPRLDEELPVLYIQQQISREVLGAAEAFVNDIYAA